MNDNIDTDQILPSSFSRLIDKKGFVVLMRLAIWIINFRDPDFVFNRPRSFKGGAILITGDNFGAGSSREHLCLGLG